VARQALQAGAHIINDVWGFKQDPKMAAVAAQAGCPVILMHNRQERDYKNYMKDILADLRDSIRTAKEAGVVDEQIMVDPGIGFAKNAHENLYFMKHLDALHELGYPILLATSRKRFIRDTLQLPVDDLVEGTAATVAFGIAQGCQIVRVHDVAQIHRTVKMCDAIYYAKQPTYE
jgi:dihydropteroate synthase